ncbi:DNA-binding PadR family transcriptional regulator [Actinokineospora cianjurensis]|uniref:DNA-binding PadR family transcriptional regulator n=2 Tax=Actinokineospora cianjurensis TaxID=585224 RepID=A0A421AYX5_9PSEU|nr:DNA-binding PadR family transcriptional regulator [Actinokineospora cianjurensis]
MTLPTQLVLRALMENPDQEMYGLEICAAAGLPSGTIHPLLARLERVGWLRSRWEDIDPAQEGRPRRRYYGLDPNSLAPIRAALTRVEASQAALTRLRPGLAGGAR